MTDETRPDRAQIAEALARFDVESGHVDAREALEGFDEYERAADAVLALLPAPQPVTDYAELAAWLMDRQPDGDHEWIAGYTYAAEVLAAHPGPAPHPQGGTETLRRIEALADDLVDRLSGLQGLLSADLEGAYQSGQSLAQKDYISDLMGRANAAWGVAVTIREAAAGRSMPSFEDLLRDPTGQYDPDGVVLKSVLDYQQRNPGQQHEFCLAPIPFSAPTTAGTALPPTGSVYVCTNLKPCPDHPAPLAAAPAPTETGTE